MIYQLQRVFLADKGYDSDKFRNALKSKNIIPCIPGRKNRKKQIAYDKKLYKNRHKIENSFSFFKLSFGDIYEVLIDFNNVKVERQKHHTTQISSGNLDVFIRVRTH